MIGVLFLEYCILTMASELNITGTVYEEENLKPFVPETFHATNHATKTNDYAISIHIVCKIVIAIKSGVKNIVFTFKKTYLLVLLLRNDTVRTLEENTRCTLVQAAVFLGSSSGTSPVSS